MNDQSQPDKVSESNAPDKPEAAEVKDAAPEKPQTAPLDSAKSEKPGESAPEATEEKPENGKTEAENPSVETFKIPEELKNSAALNDPRLKEVTHPSKSTLAGNPSPAIDDTIPPKSSKPISEEQRATQKLPDPESLGIRKDAIPSGATAMQICPTCGHHNRPGVILCENCGTNLMTGQKSATGTRDLKKEQEAKTESQEQLLDTGERKALDTAGATIFTEDMVLRIEIEAGSTPMLVYPKQEIILGRRDPNTGGMPDVDLTAYAGYRMGVSRRHAAIRLQEKHLHVSDLGSSNGTFLNGTRLNAHRPYQLRDGDEVRLGQMVLKLFFQSSKDRK
jgi:ribosomal protein L32